MPSRPLQALVCGLALWMCEVVVETLLSEVVEAWLVRLGGTRSVAVVFALLIVAAVTWWTLHKVDPAVSLASANEDQVGEVTLCETCQDQIASPRNKKSLPLLKVDISSIHTQQFHTPLPYKTPSIEKVEAEFIENPRQFLNDEKENEDIFPYQDEDVCRCQDGNVFPCQDENICQCQDEDDHPRATLAGLLKIDEFDIQEESSDLIDYVEIKSHMPTVIEDNLPGIEATSDETSKNVEEAKEEFTVEIPIIRVNKQKVANEPL